MKKSRLYGKPNLRAAEPSVDVGSHRSPEVLFRAYSPGPPLSDFVEEIWLYENCGAEHRRERILPSGTFELVINLRDDELRIYDAGGQDVCRRFSGALLSGPYAGCFVIDTAEQASTVGVHFKAGGAFPFFALAAGELADAHVDLESLWGGSAIEIRDRLCGVTTAEDRFHLLERSLIARLSEAAPHRAVRATLDLLARRGQHLTVGETAEIVGLSQRRLIDVFTAEVGLTPKLFSRVRRFQRALALADESTAPDWVQVALECGYFDQSHMIRDFVEFSGFSPAEYACRQDQLGRRGVRVKRHHLPLMD